MESPKKLRQPSNWQDFETLCKKLWGEIWQCPEIKKNGRSGQNQHGVDVYGIPLGENQYFGIQCKGKDSYTNKQFTEQEIVDEISKAKNFQPALKKFYFATTAIKDTHIEEFVRIRNLENKSIGLFEVHIFSWEDIVELIDENRQTHDWYVKSQNFKTIKSIDISFHDGSKSIVLEPKFKRTITHYQQRIIPSNSLFSSLLSDFMPSTSFRDMAALTRTPILEIKVNLSYCGFGLKIHNSGISPIDEFKVCFEFDGVIQDLSCTNEKSIYPIRSDINVRTNPKSGEILPEKTILVGDDIYISDHIYLKPLPKSYELKLKWKLISTDFRDNGELNISIKPEIKEESIDILVEDPKEVKIEKSDILDLIINKN